MGTVLLSKFPLSAFPTPSVMKLVGRIKTVSLSANFFESDAWNIKFSIFQWALASCLMMSHALGHIPSSYSQTTTFSHLERIEATLNIDTYSNRVAENESRDGATIESDGRLFCRGIEVATTMALGVSYVHVHHRRRTIVTGD